MAWAAGVVIVVVFALAVGVTVLRAIAAAIEVLPGRSPGRDASQPAMNSLPPAVAQYHSPILGTATRKTEGENRYEPVHQEPGDRSTRYPDGSVRPGHQGDLGGDECHPGRRLRPVRQ